jgi:hypothetical protein
LNRGVIEVDDNGEFGVGEYGLESGCEFELIIIGSGKEAIFGGKNGTFKRGAGGWC